MVPTEIILHHSLTTDSGTLSWGAIRRYHLDKGWRDIGYQVGIEVAADARGRESVEALFGRMLTEPGAHTYGRNRDSLGVCVVGNYDQAPPPIKVWQKTIQVVRSMQEVFGIRRDGVRAHRDYANKSCPGIHWDMDAFRSEVRL